jgi:hypothetical protein
MAKSTLPKSSKTFLVEFVKLRFKALSLSVIYRLPRYTAMGF